MTMAELARDRIPMELKQLPNWVCWHYGIRNGKKTKMPIDVENSRFASSTDSSTWTSFDVVTKQQKGIDGIGFVFDGSGLCGIDLDNCRNPLTELIKPWARSIVAELNS